MKKTTESGISRRNFLTGAAGLGALAAAGLAGCTPKEAVQPEKTAPAVISETEDWLGEAPEIAEKEIVETRETDILIVGAGMSGMSAAATAADLGANFIVVDKNLMPAAPHHDVGAINTRYTEAAGEHIDEGRLLNELNRYASFKNDSTVANTWIHNSSELIDWLEDLYTRQGINVKVEFDIENGSDGKAGGTIYYIPAECHHFTDADAEGRNARIDHIEVLTSFIESTGNSVQHGFDLAKLEREEGGRVTGAVFNTENGYVRINAAKGVVLACGGYAANPAMVKGRAPILTKCVTSLDYNQQNTGMGIKAAAWIGAALDDDAAYMIFDRGIVPPGADAGYTDEEAGTWATGGQFNLGSQPFLKVSRKGRRITNESANYDAICLAAAKHPGGVWCMVFDSNAPEDVNRFKTQGCSATTWKSTLKPGTDIDKAYEKQLSEGLMMKADTLDELADKLGFAGEDKDAFLATVEHYNEMYDAGEDTEFGKESYRLSAIRKAPFYGAWFGGALLTTLDGVRINANTQVVDTAGNVIEGLHAVGTCSGSYYSGNYPVYIVGNCLGRQMTFGRYAVRYLQGEVQ